VTLERRFGFVRHERSVGKVLAKLGYRRLSVRPRHLQADEEAQEAFKKTLPQRSRLRRGSPATPKTNLIEIWFQDEARIGQQGTLTQVWARRRTRPRAPRDQRYQWAYIFGAVCPQRRATAALVLPVADTDAMSMHLAEIGRRVAPGAHAALVIDGANYHVAARLAVPDNITLVRLPPYAPELNPVENVWEYLRRNKLPSPYSKATTTSSTSPAPPGASSPMTPNAWPQSHPELGRRPIPEAFGITYRPFCPRHSETVPFDCQESCA
jgi:hypothetical protein